MAALRAMRGRRADRGATVVQLAIAMPLVLLLIMSVIQYALFEFANQVAEAAATEGLQAATVYDPERQPLHRYHPHPEGGRRRSQATRWPPPRTSCCCSRAPRPAVDLHHPDSDGGGDGHRRAAGSRPQPAREGISAAGPIERLP